ncbi:MAG: putative selenium-dependent hydroxylase accessory protein YqeC [Deltaproteobacteria bacterium]|nr:putative selenium-dependent hydroxylase accessory protein YqeC [Deltaproteobacteria bacterium]MBT8373741.1 putative selenium-dependent hydroxylase accessory protein YqeC [Deltaproteobacteria bacterium]NNK85324.1 putative selenium-dependent hydroxylase accessory protein YqeC [Desulfobacterales bacterium]
MITLREALKLDTGGVVSFVGAGGKTSLMFSMARELSNAGESVLTTTTTKILMPSKYQSPHVILSDSVDEVLDKSRDLLINNLHISATSKRIDPSLGKLKGFDPKVIDKISKAGVFRWILVEADGANRKPLKAPASHEPVIPYSSSWLIGIVGLKCIGKSLNQKWVFRHKLYSQITGLKPEEPVTEDSVAVALMHKNGIMKNCPSHTNKVVFLNMADNERLIEPGRKIAHILCQSGIEGLKRVVIGQALQSQPVVEFYDLSEL